MLHVSLSQSTSVSTSKLYASLGNPKFNVSDARRRFFPYYIRAQNMVRVIEVKIIPREAPSREVYNLVAREARVYHSSIARPV